MVQSFIKYYQFWSLLCMVTVSGVKAQEVSPGQIGEIVFREAELSPSLYNMMTGLETPPTLTYRLPDNYNPDETYPLLVYVPGLHGGPKGNIDNAMTIAGNQGWIAASLPLFKRVVDREEVGQGILVSFQDYPTISRAYSLMLGRLLEQVPNIDPRRSAMVGYSNGALTLGVLITNQDEFILTHFKSFCLVDQGMFHLTDLHKKRTRNARYLILVGDQNDYGRDLKIRGSRLQQDSWQLLGVNLTYHIMGNTGHAYPRKYMKLTGKWIRNESIMETLPTSQ